MMLELEGGGNLQVWEEGERVFLRCERPLDRSGLFKVWVRGDGGEQLLGTLAPEGERLLLCRTLLRREMQWEGCWPVRGGCCNMVYTFPEVENWYWEADPRRLVAPEVVRAGEWRGMLCSKGKNGIQLAIPFQCGAAIPLTGLICLAQFRKVRGKECLVWYFNEKGQPVLPS